MHMVILEGSYCDVYGACTVQLALQSWSCETGRAFCSLESWIVLWACCSSLRNVSDVMEIHMEPDREQAGEVRKNA